MLGAAIAVELVVAVTTVDRVVAASPLDLVATAADSRQVIGVAVAHDASITCNADILDIDQDVAI